MLAAEATQFSQAITFAVVGALVTVLTLVLTNRAKRHADQAVVAAAAAAEEARRGEKAEDRQALIDKEARDYARQDLVADRLERATKQTVAKLKDVEDLGKVTHALVNSDKTSSMKATLTLMREVVDLKRAMGKQPTKEALDAIAELDHDIKARLAEQKAAEARVAQGGGDTEAAEMQVAAAEVQQVAATQQQAAADQVTAALAGKPTFPPPPPP